MEEGENYEISDKNVQGVSKNTTRTQTKKYIYLTFTAIFNKGLVPLWVGSMYAILKNGEKITYYLTIDKYR